MNPAFSIQTLFQGNQTVDEVEILFTEESQQMCSEGMIELE